MKTNRTILIIEDELALVNALVDKFTLEKFSVITAENGEEGLKSAIKNHPDLILLDIVMPVMDGLTMLNELVKDKWGKTAKVILLTNLSDPGKITDSVLKKVSGFMVKSDWRISDVVEEVKKKLAE